MRAGAPGVQRSGPKDVTEPLCSMVTEVDPPRASAASWRSTGCRSTSIDGELFAIIGPNGAGKTSIFNAINQVYSPQDGDIRWKGESIMGMRARPGRPQLGIARTFQNIELFPQMTVIDNLLTRASRPHAAVVAGRERLVRAGQAGGDREPRAASRTSSTSSRSSSGASTRSASCPTGSRSGSSWAGRWRWTPSCCCSTSRSPG